MKEKHKKYYCFPVTTCALIISILIVHFKPARSITRTFSLSPNCSRLERFHCECTDNQFDFNPSFTDKQSLLKYTINASVQDRLYFYLDETWGYASAEQDCAKKMAMAKFSST